MVELRGNMGDRYSQLWQVAAVIGVGCVVGGLVGFWTRSYSGCSHDWWPPVEKREPRRLRHYVKEYALAVRKYWQDCGQLPPATDDLNEYLIADPGVPGWQGPYLDARVRRDDWGNPVRFRIINGQGIVVSFGPDAMPDTDDDILIPVGINGASQPSTVPSAEDRR